MKEKITILVILIIAFAAGTFIGEGIAYLVIPRRPLTNHVCTCERCKLKRQLEAIEVVDSCFKDRIHIVVNDEER